MIMRKIFCSPMLQEPFLRVYHKLVARTASTNISIHHLPHVPIYEYMTEPMQLSTLTHIKRSYHEEVHKVIIQQCTIKHACNDLLCRVNKSVQVCKTFPAKPCSTNLRTNKGERLVPLFVRISLTVWPS